MKLISVKNRSEAGKCAAKMIIDLIAEKPNATLGLATGSSPETTYTELTDAYERGEVSFSSVRTVNLDEYVGLDGSHLQSYRYFMEEKLFSRVDIKSENTHLPNGMANDLTAECERYNEVIRSLDPIDIQLLGIGHNGHIGFNEPSDFFFENTHVVDLTTSTIEANSRYFLNDLDRVPKHALTVGIGTVTDAKEVLFLASGDKKAAAVARLMQPGKDLNWPITALKLHPHATLLADLDACSELDADTRAKLDALMQAQPDAEHWTLELEPEK
jgi:glucosamine-6-phosphate deaminase